jgi:radical SAM protein with 4Fe4S-binding SPASM domain
MIRINRYPDISGYSPIKMHGKVFQITWNRKRIIYDPSSGSIEDDSINDEKRIEKNPQSRFPGFDNLLISFLPEKFKPFCLTVHLNQYCNLECSYCYAFQKRRFSLENINPVAVEACAEIVALNCVDTGMPFILGFHGGNEPLLRPDLIQNCINICRQITSKHALELLVFCTTNGIIPVAAAKWAGQIFHGITISWDGPPDIHDRFRRHTDGTATGERVRRTAEALLNAENGLTQFKVRTTVTRASTERLLEIVHYFHDQGIKYVELYPAYQNHSNSIPEDLIPDKSSFVKNYLRAGKWGKMHGMEIGFAGSRLADYHDKYCQVYQHNLTVTPDGYLTACFLAVDNHRSQNNQFIYGHYDGISGKIVIDWKKLGNILKALAQSYPQCVNCFNYMHCAKSCPSICPIRDVSVHSDGFDCTMEKWIGLANIIEASGYELSDDEIQNCDSFFHSIHIDEITRVNEYVRV